MNPTNKEKILVIAGDGAFGERIIKILTSAGYTAILVKNGAEGLKSIVDNLPHLVLLDIVLTGGDAYEILEKKHAEPMLAKIPLFLMSTQGIPINMRRVPDGSVTEYITGLHSDSFEVVEKIDRHFGHARPRAESPVFSAPAPAPASAPVGAAPAAASAETPPPAPAQAAQSSSKKRVLWVEDDKLIGTILSKKLISSDFDLTHANNGEEALQALKTMNPDVIVLDLMLPEMSGFDILQSIRNEERLKNTPVIIFSNLSKQSDIDRAKALGAHKFLVKAATSLDQIVASIKEASA